MTRRTRNAQVHVCRSISMYHIHIIDHVAHVHLHIHVHTTCGAGGGLLFQEQRPDHICCGAPRVSYSKQSSPFASLPQHAFVYLCMYVYMHVCVCAMCIEMVGVDVDVMAASAVSCVIVRLVIFFSHVCVFVLCRSLRSRPRYRGI